MPNATPFGNIVILLAILGAGTLMAWIVSTAEQLISRATPKVKAWLEQKARDRALRRMLRNVRPRPAREREAMEESARETLAAFERAQAAMLLAR